MLLLTSSILTFFGVLIFLLYWNRKLKLVNELVALLVLTITLAVFFELVLTNQPQWEFLHNLLALLLTGVLLFVGPLMYIYVSALLGGEEVRNQLRGFSNTIILPITVLLINLIGFVLIAASAPESILNSISHNILFFVNFASVLFILPCQNIFYLSKSFNTYRTLNNEKLTESALAVKRWLGLFLISYLAFWIAVYTLQVITSGQSSWPLLILTVGITSFWLYKTSLLPKEPLIDKKLEKEILEKLNKAIIEDKLYLNPEVSLGSLSKSIGTNSKYLRYVIAENFEQSFSTFINHYRISDVERMLQDASFEVYTIESIGEMAGFKSKSSFYAAFKEKIGQTPRTYRKHLNL